MTEKQKVFIDVYHDEVGGWDIFQLVDHKHYRETEGTFSYPQDQEKVTILKSLVNDCQSALKEVGHKIPFQATLDNIQHLTNKLFSRQGERWMPDCCGVSGFFTNEDDLDEFLEENSDRLDVVNDYRVD